MNLRECCKAIRLLIFAIVLQASYDEKLEVFLSPDRLPKKSLDFIQCELEIIIKRSSKQKDNVKLTSFGGLFTAVGQKTEVQDLLDSILKIVYPYISQARNLIDINEKQDYSRSGAGLKFRILPEALPVGHEDKVPVVIGTRNDEHGKKELIKVDLWRSLKNVHYELNGARFFKPVFSPSDPVDMEDASIMTVCPVTTFTVTTAGFAWTRWPSVPGDYSLTDEEEFKGLVVCEGQTMRRKNDGTLNAYGHFYSKEGLQYFFQKLNFASSEIPSLYLLPFFGSLRLIGK